MREEGRGRGQGEGRLRDEKGERMKRWGRAEGERKRRNGVKGGERTSTMGRGMGEIFGGRRQEMKGVSRERDPVSLKRRLYLTINMNSGLGRLRISRPVS